MRSRLRSRLLAAFAAAGFLLAAPPRAAEPALSLVEVARGVHVHFGVQEDWLPSNGGDVANIGFVVGTRCVAVVDSGGSLEIGRRLKRAVEATTKVPVCYVINSHSHPDHVLGNAAFMGGPDLPKVVAHKRLGASLAARERNYLNAVERDFGVAMAREQIVYPTLAVDKRLELDLGGRTLVLDAWPTAHTDHDLTVLDTATRTLFLSDLLFVERLPVLDGNLRGWLSVLAELSRLDVKLAVPGHGPSSGDWPKVLEPQLGYLQALLSETRAAIKRRMTITEAVEQVGRNASRGWLLADQFHRRNVTAAYAELEWED